MEDIVALIMFIFLVIALFRLIDKSKIDLVDETEKRKANIESHEKINQ